MFEYFSRARRLGRALRRDSAWITHCDGCSEGKLADFAYPYRRLNLCRQCAEDEESKAILARTQDSSLVEANERHLDWLDGRIADGLRRRP